jgi:cation transport regulator ChaB
VKEILGGALGDSRTLVKAARGDREAVTKVVRQSLPKVHGKIKEARDTIDRLHATEWDAEARRQEAMNGEYAPHAAAAAVDEVYGKVLAVTHLIPLVLIAQGDERAVYEEKLADNVYNLLVAVHNPTIRYAVIGAMDEEIREDVDQRLQLISAEIWGTLLATTDSGDLTIDDFPQGTRDVLDELAESFEDMGAE